MISIRPSRRPVLLACCLAFAAKAQAVDLHVMISGGFAPAYQRMVPVYEHRTGNDVVTAWGPSMGATPQAIPQRLAQGEPADVVIMVGYALDQLIKEGKVIAGSRVELADSRIGMVVKTGAAKPDIGSVDALRATLLAAKSIAYSDSASGTYIHNELFRKMGIEDRVAGKAKMIPRVPVATVVADGEYQLGFQQVSELLPVKGTELVGKIPESLQSVTRYAAGIPVSAAHPVEAKALLQFMSSPGETKVIAATGMDPLTARH
ncbi:substrate-binding domain-containing protein [Robbsia sp. Bb-Pol-6]|uniref:Substrate-binding domain-containing protein n=1 Tax=Robbsia betulipollinis TaxID=2981849 RepID=A0ABT3ZKG0_9BURK|nr:substrate-binding domain-containing protein [Robbsia betulipollinis]MCY0387001.1 substrate-binding domain-containing protein [Robbsia betulipollinis]